MKFAKDFIGFTYTARMFVIICLLYRLKCNLFVCFLVFFFFFGSIYILAMNSTANAVVLNKQLGHCTLFLL